MIPFCTIFWISSDFFTRPVEAPLIWEERFTWNVPQICINRGKIWRGDILVADMEEMENMDTSDIYPRRINAKEVLTPHRCQYFFSSSWEQQNRQEKTAYSKYPLQNRNNLYRVKIPGEKFKANWKGFNRQNQKDDAEARKDFGSIPWPFWLKNSRSK